ncbi:MAG TPA: nucleoside hydrolase [Solirubrobacteraceae bacterium]|nr:nucleoside hydrolase [Solirubrobacteraceae bacterium]
MPTPVLIDCDPGHDDAIALLLALASPELELLGVSTVHGNQTLELTTANALRVLEFVGSGLPVAAGADRPLLREPAVAAEVHGETGLDGPDLPPPRGAPVGEHAVEFLAARLAEADRPVTLIPTGPLTNVALLLATHPEAAERIERIVLMGGAIAEGNVTPAAEFNIWVDPEAAARVFASGLDVTMVGLDVTHRALMTGEHAERLRAAGRVGTLVAELWAFYHRFHSRIYGLPGSPVHDAMAVAHVIRDDLVQTRHVNVEVDCASELCRGRTVVDVWGRTERPPNAHVGVDVDAEAFLELLVERIASLG